MRINSKYYTYTFLFLCLSMTFTHTHAQRNNALLSQQMFSRINTNPAAISISNYVDAFLLVRKQWWGFEGAPSTQVLNLQGYLPYVNSGIGASITSDFFGNNYSLNAKLAYSYHVKTGQRSYFSFGINAGVLYKNYRASKIVVDDSDDPFIPIENVSDIKPDFDFGVVFNHPVFSMGLSATHLTSFLYDKDDYYAPQLGFHGFMEVRAKCSENFVLIPNISALYVNNLFQGEFNLTALIQKIWWIGASYRLNDAVVAMTGVQIKGFRFGYSYDLPLGAVKGKSSGSHEIMLNIRIKSTNEINEAQHTPRFFE